MTVFWMLAGLLVIVALLFVLPPLLRKPREQGVQRDQLNLQVIRDQLAELRADLEAGRLEQEAYAAARHDLERELLEDVEAGPVQSEVRAGKGRWMAVLLFVLVPAVALAIYTQIGSQGAVQIETAATGTGEPGAGQHPLAAMVQRLAEKMKQQPDNLEGWALLGRSYAAINRFDDAADAYRHALKLSADNPELLSSYADVLVAVHNGEFTDQVGQLLDKALAIDPHHLKSLWLRGHWRFRHNDYKGAIADWKAVLQGLPPGDENASTVQQQIRAAQMQLGEPLDQIAPVASAEQGAGASKTTDGAKHSVKVHVSLDPTMKDKVSPDDTLFIFARAVQGPPMPLAIVRKRAADLPLTVTLDDSLAMSPAMVMSRFAEVSIGARISKSGQAMPASGDVQGMVSPVKPDGREVTVTIDQLIP